ncbi:MAG: alkaline phosphatase family protein [Acidimicrobiales bacterium]|nr:alkaline phosphatase family protein [Acidimicrobiales bacterium]
MVIRRARSMSTFCLALAVMAALTILVGCTSGSTQSVSTASESDVLINGRQLKPQGMQVELGNFPTGGAVTDDGRFLWTVSTGFGSNDIRIVDTASKKVIQTVQVPSATGGVALDSAHRLAYVSGVPLSRWQPSLMGLPGAEGNCVLVYSWDAESGEATQTRVIPVPSPDGSPGIQSFPPVPQRSNAPTGAASSWPQKLAVSPDGTHLLVPLNLADSAAVVSLGASDTVDYVPIGSHPYGAAVSPDGRIGLVSNEASGTLSVIDIAAGKKLGDITVGPPLSHPQGIAIDAKGERAYVAMSAMDQVVVVDLKDREVERTISVGRSAGLGTMPVALSLSPDGSRLFVAESGADSLAVIRIPGAQPAPEADWKVLGNIPTAEDPQVVVTAPAQGDKKAQLMYVSARGLGVGPNLTGPDPAKPDDPLFWAFNPVAPTTDVFADSAMTYLPSLVMGRAGLMSLPSDAEIEKLTPTALKQIQPTNAQDAPKDTPVRANGPIKHVFFIVRENRSYDQLLGDIGRGNSDPKLVVFGKDTTPNLHSLVTRFPLLDNTFANSEASIQGHYWTSSASVPDYVDRNWVHEYAGRGRPNDFGVYAVTFPGNMYLFNQAEKQRISYFNYGEAFGANIPQVEDRDRSPELRLMEATVAEHSDLGPGLTKGGTYSSSFTVGQNIGADPKNPLDGETFDSSLPTGAPSGATSHVDSFRARFASQLATGTVPTFNYLILMSDHTRGTQPGFPTPTAMVADSDLAVGQIVETISHSPIWESSAIFLVEDDSQDGADHVDAHRIPVAVISPYARKGAVINTRYDQPSVLRTMELIIGMEPLSINDAVATPMYDVFTSEPLNAEPVDAIVPDVNLLERNTPASPWAAESGTLALNKLDATPQRLIDVILWKSVYGADSQPPPPGPNAEYEEGGEDED